MAATNESSSSKLRVSVVNGNLRFVRQPLMLGHYRAMALTGTEWVMDCLIGGAMQASLAMGQYPELPGTHQVFVNTVNRENPLQPPRPEAVIVVGLGEEGKLRAADLARTVRQGVVAWAQRLAECSPPAPTDFELAATLIGSGGTGISAGQAAFLVAQGVLDANQRLAKTQWPSVRQLYLIELFLDRATEAWRALQVQAAATPERFAVAEVIQTGVGALRRPLDESYRGTRYDLITAVSAEGEHSRDTVLYTLDTRRARTEVRAQATQRPLLRELVAVASNDKNTDPQIGRTLFQLLVPVEMEAYLAGTTEALLELDGGTAGIPWEMLHAASGADGGGDTRPWAIRAKLLRKLRTPTFRSQVVDANSEASVLVIGEPACDSTRYRRLPSAHAEARKVADLLEEKLGLAKVTALISSDPSQPGPGFRRIINALLERNWRIVHLTGHGEPPEHCAGAAADPRGVVLSNGVFLGPREIGSMRVVPELVFVNCCHLAARDPEELLQEDDLVRSGGYDRARFAATVAEALIALGVRCVIAAGWAVEDEAAKAFATTFYKELMAGRRFIDAVAAARQAAYDEDRRGNTWAAYQCYGDPEWRLQRGEVDAASEPPPPEEVFANVASPATLMLALETMAVISSSDPAERERLPQNLDFLEKRFAERWGHMGAVAEAFGTAWAAAKSHQARAAEWYRRALRANDGRASIRAAEQLGNLRSRLAWEAVAKAQQPSDGADRAALQETIDAARREIEEALALLERIADIQTSIERESLRGSAWKRKAMLEALAGVPQAEAEALAAMKEHYGRAEALARENGAPDLFYPALNRMAAELILDAAEPDWPGFDPARLEEVRASLKAKTNDDPDFWSVVGLIELRVYEAVARGKLAGDLAAIEREYEDLRRRVSIPWQWASVRDQVRFVLPKYAARASAAEQEASAALMRLLEDFAR